MSRAERLFEIIAILGDGGRHRAEDLAARLKVSVRTLYRDMDRLIASGVPVAGERGSGYRMRDLTMLPPLALTAAEVEALALGVAIVGEAADPGLKAAAASLADKIDAALPERAVAEAEARALGPAPFADAARGFRQMPVLRAAIRGRQKLRLTCIAPDGAQHVHEVRPLALDHRGRVWILTAWCETTEAFRVFRADLFAEVRALPALFVDEPGKRLADVRGVQAS